MNCKNACEISKIDNKIKTEEGAWKRIIDGKLKFLKYIQGIALIGDVKNARKILKLAKWDSSKI